MGCAAWNMSVAGGCAVLHLPAEGIHVEHNEAMPGRQSTHPQCCISKSVLLLLLFLLLHCTLIT